MSSTQVTIVGAGKRVLETALPAFLRAPEDYSIRAILARSERPVEVEGRTFALKKLADLTAEDVASTDLFYVAVGKGAMPAVLEALTKFDVSKKALLIDTPVLLWKHVRFLDLIEKFGRASVAEDCIALPWYDAVFEFARRRGLGKVRTAQFYRSAYKYHGIAMARAVLGTSDLVRARSWKRDGDPIGLRGVLGDVGREYRFGDGRSVYVGEPRDYAVGSFEILFDAAAVTDQRDPTLRVSATRGQILEPICDQDRCIGVRIEDVEVRLDEDEASLLRMRDPSLSITARMEDWKRVGFLRLLRRSRAGEAGYPVLDGLEDSLVDMQLEKLGRYRKNPFTSVKSRSGRWFLSRLR